MPGLIGSSPTWKCQALRLANRLNALRHTFGRASCLEGEDGGAARDDGQERSVRRRMRSALRRSTMSRSGCCCISRASAGSGDRYLRAIKARPLGGVDRRARCATHRDGCGFDQKGADFAAGKFALQAAAGRDVAGAAGLVE